MGCAGQNCRACSGGHGRVEPYGTATRKPTPRHTADFGRARLSENDTDEGRPLGAGHELPNAYRCGHGKLVAKADRGTGGGLNRKCQRR